MAGSANLRATAAFAVHQVVFRGRQLPRTLERALAGYDSEDRGLVTEMTSGAVRWFWLLEHYLNILLDKPMQRKHQEILCLLYVGLYQLEFMNTPVYASVSETVNAASEMGKPWARGLINAIMRKYLRIRDQLDVDEFPDHCHYSHPAWMVDLIKQEWPQYWKDILQANNRRPKMTIRVNINKTNVPEYLDRLDNLGIAAAVDPSSPSAIELEHRTSIDNLPGFGEGVVSVQSVASQLTALSMDLAPGHRVLDACSAPGGKLLHMLEIQPDLDEVVAVDIDQTRTAEIVDNLNRANMNATVISADSSRPDDWWDGKPFDRILVDAPCSALGVISKHPDIKHHRKPEDIEQTAQRQGQLLEALLPLVKLNGKLLYSTCSILSRENDSQIENIVQNHRSYTCDSLPSTLGQSTRFGRQRLQGSAGGDGFYYAGLIRR